MPKKSEETVKKKNQKSKSQKKTHPPAKWVSMSMWCSKTTQLSVCAKNELRVSCSESGEARQKIVSATEGPADRYFNYDELCNLACMLHDVPEFRSDAFRAHRGLIENLGRTIVFRRDRPSLVAAMLLLMDAWVNVCEKDAFCILPPNLATLHDPQQQKVLGLIERLKVGTLNNSTEIAELRKTNGNLSGQPYAPTTLQEQLLQTRDDLLVQRVNAGV